MAILCCVAQKAASVAQVVYVFPFYGWQIYVETLLDREVYPRVKCTPQRTYRGRGGIGGSFSALSAGANTTTLLVMVDRVKGSGCAPPTLTRLGWFYLHDGTYARKWPLPLCLLCGAPLCTSTYVIPTHSPAPLLLSVSLIHTAPILIVLVTSWDDKHSHLPLPSSIYIYMLQTRVCNSEHITLQFHGSVVPSSIEFAKYFS